MEENNKNNSSETIREIKIGKITYTVVSHFSETAKDTAESKIERLIMRDLEAS